MDIQDIEYSLAKRVPAMAGGFSIETNYGEITLGGPAAAPVIAAVRESLERSVKGLPPATPISAAVLEVARKQIDGALDHGRIAVEMCNGGSMDWLAAFNRLSDAEQAVAVSCAVLGQLLCSMAPNDDAIVIALECTQIEAQVEFSALRAQLQGVVPEAGA